jgi:hypothetical protein
MDNTIAVALIGGLVSVVLGIVGVFVAIKLNLPALGLSITTEQAKLIETLEGRVKALEAQVYDLEIKVGQKDAEVIALNKERRTLQRRILWLEGDLETIYAENGQDRPLHARRTQPVRRTKENGD